MKNNLIVYLIYIVLILFMGCTGETLDGTFVDSEFESLNKGNVFRYEFSPDGKFIITWTMPKVTAPNMLDIDMVKKGTYEIKDDIIIFAVTEEKNVMYGKNVNEKLPYEFHSIIIFKNENTLELKRRPNEGEELDDYGTTKLMKM